MKRSIPILLVLGLVMTALPALASGGGGGHGPSPKAESKGTPGNNVEMPTLMAPVSDAGKLVAYAYISARIEATSVGAALDIREKLAFIQDAFVREVNRNSVSVPGQPDHIDEHKLQARMLAAAQKIMGGKKIKNLTITKVQVALLYPKATPQPLPPPEMMAEQTPAKPQKAASSGHH